tara:strand:- start:914 stop:1426 length:513 start_codon:yes stop_codon:yes gene_type:complete
MKNQIVIAIDPGTAGGIAIRIRNEVFAYKMPDTIADIRDLIESFAVTDAVIYMERVGTYMPGNSGPSAATFAEHVGALKGIICCLRIPVIFPTPATWMNHFIGKQSYEKKVEGTTPQAWKIVLSRRKQERKNKIKAKAQELYPHLKVTLALSDALGILNFGCEQEAGNSI